MFLSRQKQLNLISIFIVRFLFHNAGEFFFFFKLAFLYIGFVWTILKFIYESSSSLPFHKRTENK